MAEGDNAGLAGEMNVLLIAPGFGIRERYGFETKSKRGFLPPLGLGYIAAVLEQAGHKVAILDISAQGYTDGDIRRLALQFNPQVVGFSLLTPSAPKTFALARYLKRYLPLPFIFGGPHASCFPSDCLDHSDGQDTVVVGEGEQTIVELLEWFEGRKHLAHIKGIAYRWGEVVINPPRPYIADLDSLPFPSRHLFDMPRYMPLPNNYKRLPATNMITSRGCPYHCTFCFQGGKGGLSYRRHSPARVVDEMALLVRRYGIREISFWDDNFAMNKKWVLTFCELLKNSGLDISWSCVTRVDSVSPDVLEAMARAGCWNVFYGLETGNQQLLDNIKKGTTVEQNRRAVGWAKEAGIEVRASFMLALPGETPELGEETIRFALELDPDYVQFSPTTPMPGTELWDTCQKAGALGSDLSQYTLWTVTYVPEGYKDAQQVRDLQKRAYRRFYLRPKYIWGRLKRIRNLQDFKRCVLGLMIVLGVSK